MKNYKINFMYADAYSNWEWRSQSCTVFASNKDESITKAMELYGLGIDCDYRIVSIEEI